MVSSICFEHSRVHPQGDLYVHFDGISFNGSSKHVEDTIIKLKHSCKKVCI